MPFPITANTVSDASSNGTFRSHRTAPHRGNATLSTGSQSPYQQRTTQHENPTQQLIKQAIEFLIKQLEAGKSETLTAFLAAMARFHKYSFGNILAIARKKPDTQRVAGIRTWNELGRFVKKGEKGIQILAPIIGHRRKKVAAEQDQGWYSQEMPVSMLIGFRAVYVFERLSRDLRPGFYPLDVTRDTPHGARDGSQPYHRSN